MLVLRSLSIFVQVTALLMSNNAQVTVAGFQIKSLAKIKKCGVNHAIEKQRTTTELLASLQEERKQVKSRNGSPTGDSGKQHHQHHSHHQQSPLVIIQPTHSQEEQHNHYHHVDNHNQHHLQKQSQSPLILTLNTKEDHDSLPAETTSHLEQKSHVLSIEEMSPIFQFTNKKGKTKVINLYGLYNIFVIATTMPFWVLAMETLQRLGDAIAGFDENRAKFDYSGKIWCRTYLRLIDCYPEIGGDVSRLKDREEGGYGGACLFVANHASFLDIPVLCTVLDPVFKFIAKDSLVAYPGVGKQLVGGEHILIDRNDKRSQLRSFKQAINYLKDGVPIMAFPEGARSPDGRLMAFKPGLFSMAVKAKVPIVPLSISNAHAVMPSEGLVPVQRGKGMLRVYVHDPIDVDGKSEERISEEVREALLSELPIDQHPKEI